MRLPFSYGCSNRRPLGFAAIADKDSSMDLGDSERTICLSRSGWRGSPGAGIVAPALLLTAGLALLLVPAPGVLAQEGPAHAAPPRDLISGEPVAPPSSVPGQAATADAGDDCERYSAPFFRGSGGFVVAPRDGRSAEMTVQSGSGSDGRTVTAGRDGLAVDLLRSSLCFGRNGVFPAQCRISFSGIKGGGWYWVNGDRNAAVAPLVCSEDLGGGAAPLEPGGVQTLPSRFGTGTLFVHDTQGLMGIVPQLSPTGRAGAPKCDRFVAPFFRGKGGFVARPEADRVAEVIVRRDNAVTRKRLTPGADGLAVQLLSDSLCTDANGEAVECQVSFTGIGGGGWYWVNGDRNAAVAPLVCEGRPAGAAAAVPGGVVTSRAAFGTGSLFVHDTQRLMGIVPHLPGATEDLDRVEVRVSVFGGGAVEVVGGEPLNCQEARLCSGWFPAAGSVTLRPRNPFGYVFDSWQGCDSVKEDDCVVALHADRLVFVDFLSTEPLTLEDNVVEFDRNRLNDVERFDPVSGLIVLSHQAKVDDIGVGSVLVSSVIDSDRDFESYFLRRVTELPEVAGPFTYVKTAPASLSDLIATGSLALRTPLGSEAVSSYVLSPELEPISHPKSDLRVRELPDGRRSWEIRRQAVDTPGAVATPSLSSVSSPIEFGIKTDLVPGKLSVSGKIELGFDNYFVLDAGFWKGFREFKGVVTVRSSATLKVHMGPNLKPENEKYEVPLDIQIPFGAIPVGPVVITPVATGKVILTLDARTGFEPEARMYLYATAGAQYVRDGGGWSDIWDWDRGAALDVPDALKIEASAKALLSFDLETRVFSLAGPKVGVGPFLEVSAKLPGEGECAFDLKAFQGIEATFGGKIEFLFWEWSHRSTLFDASYQLFDWCVGQSSAAPSPPHRLRFPRTTSGAISVKWDPPQEGGGSGLSYDLERSYDPGLGPDRVEKKVIPMWDASFTDRPLFRDTEYCYRVRARTADGRWSAWSGQSCQRTLGVDFVAPGAPAGLVAEAHGQGAVELRWSSPADGEGLSHYAIMEVVEGEQDETYIASTEGLTHVVTGLTPNTDYCFSVVAIDYAGNASDAVETACAATSEAGGAGWRFREGCTEKVPDYRWEGFFDLDEGFSSVVSVAAVQGIDYDGSENQVVLTGFYDSRTRIFDVTTQNFERPHGRWELALTTRYMVDLSQNDTGDVLPISWHFEPGWVPGCGSSAIRFDRQDVASTSLADSTRTLTRFGRGAGPPAGAESSESELRRDNLVVPAVPGDSAHPSAGISGPDTGVAGSVGVQTIPTRVNPDDG